jgi:tRNA 2-thiouridine synthesizing protein E
MNREINGREIALSEAGWLDNPAEWDDEIALLIAGNEKVEMTQEHWDVVRTARGYYEEYGMNAEVRVFLKLMKEKYGPDRATNQYVYQLFPYGLVKSANKIAGLPRPKGCS